MKKIVYATNISENSIATLKYTYKISKFFDAHVIVLHIVSSGKKLTKDKRDKVLEEQKQKLENFCSFHLGDSFENLDLTSAVRNDDSVIKGMLNYIKDMELDMLVIGACGSDPVRELLFGSTAKEMIAHSTFPILTVPRGFQYQDPRKILYATDFEEQDVFYLKKLLKILAPKNLEIIVGHVTKSNHHPDKSEKHLDLFRKLKINDLNYDKLEYKLLHSNNIPEELMRFIDKENIDMVAMLERKDSDQISSFLHKDIVSQIQSLIKVPLLIFKK